MESLENNITIVIVTFKSEKVIEKCLNSIDKKNKIIIIENSNNIDFKKYIEDKFPNIECHLTGSNLGMGPANNIGIKLVQTKYVLILNPDVELMQDTIINLKSEILKIKDFAIASPIEITDLKKRNYGFFQEKNTLKIEDQPFKVDYVDGFAMLINKSKFKKDIFFDENIFMYLENTDICKRMLNNNEFIYVVPKSKIAHYGAKAVDQKFFNEVEISRNWHWMWSTFYYNKKHFGYFFALKKTYKKLITSLFKFLFFLITFNPIKRRIYFMRFSGLYNAIIGKKSWYRAEIK